MKRNHILYLSILLATVTGLPAYAQDEDVTAEGNETTAVKKKAPVVKKDKYPTVSIKGTVIDATTKQPLAGIQIQTLNDIHYTAMTNEKGEFTIKVPTFATALYVHAPQYLSQQVPISEGMQIQLIADKFRTMYVDGTDILADAKMEENHTTSQSVETDIENNLGADVRAITRNGGPGYGAAMFIHGLNTLNANAQPLFVIDGVVRDMQPTRTTLHYGDYNNLLLNLNPEDIDNVTVLKNGSAIYGAKGANGVIIINTKRSHSMATRIDANIGAGVVLKPNLPDMMNASEYRLYASEMLGTYPDIDNIISDPTHISFLIDDPDSYYYKTYHNDTDWSKEVYRTAITQNYSINVQGGDDVGMYNLSLGYTDGQSTAKENKYSRLNVRFNTDINVMKHITTKFDMAYTKINRDVFDNGAPEDFTSGPVSSPTLLALIKAPFLSPYEYNSAGELSDRLADADSYLTNIDEDLTLGNPTALLENGSGINKNRVENTEFMATIAPTYEFSKSLKLTETFNYILERTSQRYYRPLGGMPTFLIEGLGRVQSMSKSSFSKETGVSSDTRLQWTHQFAAHYFNVFGGFRYNSFNYDSNDPTGQYSTGGNDKQPNISSSMTYTEATGENDKWRSATWYVNADYNYRNRYFVNAMLAAETSSRFGDNASGLSLFGVKWGIFPGINLGWNMTNESWFPKNSFVNYLLVKGGYEINGNDDISNYAARTSFTVHTYLNRTNYAQLNNIGNEDISYEKTGKLNLGFKTYMLNNRLGVDFNFFYNHTSDLLTLKSFDNPVAGINNYWSNGGSLDNTGLEFTITGKPVIAHNFSIELGASLGHYKNEVKSLPNDDLMWVDGEQTAQGYTSSIYGDNNVATIIGQPVGVFYGYKTAGVFSTDAEAQAAGNGTYLYMTDDTGAREYFKAGDVHFVDLNGDGEISEADKTIIGDPNPDIYGNFFANINWKDFTLSLGFNYSVGNDIYNYERSILESESNFYNQTTAVNNRWRTEGQVTDMPKLAYGDPMGNSRFSDRWIEDGSYLRLKTLNLTYKVPVNLSWLQGLSIWVQADNLFTITHYLGSDPEFSCSNGVLYQGIDTGNVALSRAFTLGLKINL